VVWLPFDAMAAQSCVSILHTAALSTFDTGKYGLDFYFTWRVLDGGASRQTIFSSRPFVSISQSIPWALRMASAGLAPEAVEQCMAPLNVMHTSY
jgi:hypothetical protein